MNRGKWSQAGVPHRGWVCTDVEDLGEPLEVCQMCESQEIRYVHYMTHPDFVGTLACGCDCAGHMENDLIRAEERDKTMRNSAKRRSNFPSLKSWKRSSKGNQTIEKDGMRVTIFQKSGKYKFVVNHPRLEHGKFGRSVFNTEEEAKLASFDAMIWLKHNIHQFAPM